MWLGNVIKQRRTTLGLSVKQASEKIGISKELLYKIESRERIPKLDVLRCIAIAYSVPMWVFFYCADDGVVVDKEIAPAYKSMRKSVNQIVKEFL